MVYYKIRIDEFNISDLKSYLKRYHTAPAPHIVFNKSDVEKRKRMINGLRKKYCRDNNVEIPESKISEINEIIKEAYLNPKDLKNLQPQPGPTRLSAVRREQPRPQPEPEPMFEQPRPQPEPEPEPTTSFPQHTGAHNKEQEDELIREALLRSTQPQPEPEPTTSFPQHTRPKTVEEEEEMTREALLRSKNQPGSAPMSEQPRPQPEPEHEPMPAREQDPAYDPSNFNFDGDHLVPEPAPLAEDPGVEKLVKLGFSNREAVQNALRAATILFSAADAESAAQLKPKRTKRRRKKKRPSKKKPSRKRKVPTVKKN